jgi:hypothetical protein
MSVIFMVNYFSMRVDVFIDSDVFLMTNFMNL